MTLTDGLRGAALLARGRSEGVQRFTGDLAAASRSFVAAPVCLLLFALTRAVDWQVSGEPAQAWHSGLLELLAFVVGWAGFALVSHAVLRRAGLERRWPLYIVAWNWCNVVSYGLGFVVALPDLLHGPAMLSEALGLILYGWAIWLEWYAAMLTLERDKRLATLLVLIDFALSTLLALLV